MNKPLISLYFLFISANASAEITPRNDMAILHLSQASMICEALKEVNPISVNITEDDSQDYFHMAVRLYSIFHEMPYEEAEGHQHGWLDLFTSETVIKAQSLRSDAGAKSYSSYYLNRTDAQSCSEIRAAASNILAIYGYEL